MKISVVIPVYNSGRFLAQALESVFGQAEPADEIIVVDDGSTDDTAQVAANFGDRIKYIYQPNAGPAVARNRGVRESSGEWVAFLDADDAWLPWSLSVEKKAISRNTDVALFCGRRIEMYGEISPPSETDIEKTRGILLEEFTGQNIVATSTVIMRRDVFIRLGGFDKTFRGPEDYDLWMRVAKEYSLVYIDVPLCRYRSVSGSLSMNDRTFLSQGLRVLDKAFGEGGALSVYVASKGAAVSNLYWGVSWMAFERGARFTALRYLLVSLMQNKHPKHVRQKWLKRMLRFAFGRHALDGAGRCF